MNSFDDTSKTAAGASDEPQPTRLSLERSATTEADEEARMRQALGLFGQRGGSTSESSGGDRRSHGGGTGGSHMQVGSRRHRFVQDGEVPVSVVRGRRDQQSADLGAAFPRNVERRIEDDLASERQRAELAEKRLAESQASLRSLQTRLGHAELERDEAVGELRALREQLLQPRADAAPANPPVSPRAGHAFVEIEAASREFASNGSPVAVGAGAGAHAEDDQAGRRRAIAGRRRRDDTETGGDEPEPIKWWL